MTSKITAMSFSKEECKYISEKTLEPKLRDAVKSMGGLCLKFIPTFFTGAPDRLILMPGGKVYWAETKSTGDKPRPRQVYVHEQLRKLGFKVYVIDNNETLDQCLKEIK